MFLTTDRVRDFDDAIQSRITPLIVYSSNFNDLPDGVFNHNCRSAVTRSTTTSAGHARRRRGGHGSSKDLDVRRVLLSWRCSVSSNTEEAQTYHWPSALLPTPALSPSSICDPTPSTSMPPILGSAIRSSLLFAIPPLPPGASGTDLCPLFPISWNLAPAAESSKPKWRLGISSMSSQLLS